MILRQIAKPLPKKRLQAAVPPESVSSQIYRYLSRLVKLSLVLPVLLFFSGYQPVLAFPPIRRSIAYANFSQSQSIKAANLAEPFSLPHPGYVSTHFSAWHPGVDITAELGTSIHPILKGKIIDIVYGIFGLGHFVTVEHEQGYKSTYGHMGKIVVKIGDQVTPSSILGEVGMTGHTSGPHTHLEITHDGSYIDPQMLLPNLPNLPATFSATTH